MPANYIDTNPPDEPTNSVTEESYHNSDSPLVPIEQPEQEPIEYGNYSKQHIIYIDI